jgi:hypothetical protein
MIGLLCGSAKCLQAASASQIALLCGADLCVSVSLFVCMRNALLPGPALQEYRILRRTAHPYIVQCLGACVTGAAATGLTGNSRSCCTSDAGMPLSLPAPRLLYDCAPNLTPSNGIPASRARGAAADGADGGGPCQQDAGAAARQPEPTAGMAQQVQGGRARLATRPSLNSLTTKHFFPSCFRALIEFQLD